MIGHGFDDDDEIDLSDITEQDVLQKKLRLMHEQLENKYQQGFEA